MSYLGNEPGQIAGYSVQTKAAPVGSSITLNQEGSVNAVLLFLDGVRQTPTTDYTISGTTLTLTSTAPTTAVATVLHLGDVVDIGTPGSSTVNVAELGTDSAGSTGQFLKKSGASAIDWATVDALPSQTSQSGKFLTTDGSSASWATVAGGLTDATIWRQNTTTSASTTDTFFTAGWEIPDNTDTGYGTLGTAVGETSGVFDFKSTGYWLVIFNIMITASGGEREGIGRIHATEDDGTYVECSKATCSSGNTLNDTATMFHLMKVEDIADYKIKFSHAMAGASGTVQGSTTVNQTYAVFVKLADI